MGPRSINAVPKVSISVGILSVIEIFSNIAPEEIFTQHQLGFYATLFLKFISINLSRKCHVNFSFYTEMKLKLDNASYKNCIFVFIILSIIITHNIYN